MFKCKSKHKVLPKGLEQAQPNANLEARNIVLSAKRQRSQSLTAISKGRKLQGPGSLHVAVIATE